MHFVLSEKKKEFLLGNEAIVRGALEAGVNVATTYPGTPSSEIGNTFAKIAKQAGIYFEYSVNEKVALETAAGAAFCGARSIVSMKHYGANVALDSLLPLVYFGSPFVLVVTDDPGCWSSVQTEQDSRWISRMGFIPTLEPADAQECKEFVVKAFEIAETYKIPVMIRMTTRVCHTRGVVTLGKIKKREGEWKFVKDYDWFLSSSSNTVRHHREVLEKIEKIREEVSEKDEFNVIEGGSGKMGIITSGVCYSYVKEALRDLNVNLPLLKIGMSYPLPEDKIAEFLSKVDEVLIVEEIEPIIEGEVRKIMATYGIQTRIHGKDLLPRCGEMTLDDVFGVLSKLLGREEEVSEKVSKRRTPTFCPGCPHRATFFAIKKALGEDKVFGGDIGCYLLGTYPPYKEQDFVIAMGASVGVSHGIQRAMKQKPVIIIGDSTFFHAGMPGLLNLVFNKGDALMIVLDNRVTAMTGHQPHPGTGMTGMGEETKAVKIEDIAKAFCADWVEVANAFNVKEVEEKVRELYSKKGVCVLVVKGECRLLTVRRLVREGKKIPKFEIVDQDKVRSCEDLKLLKCPAIRKKGEEYYIDQDLCWGCGVCAQICEGIKPKVVR